MKSLALFFLILIQSVAFAGPSEIKQIFSQNGLVPVVDTSKRRINSILLFLSDRANLKMEASLINQLGAGVHYTIVKKPGIAASELISLIKKSSEGDIDLEFIDFDRCFTPWIQDYFLRMTDKNNNSVLLPTTSKNLMMNECRPFELGIADVLESKSDWFSPLEKIDYTQFQSSTQLFSLFRVESGTGEMYTNSKSYSRMFPVRTFNFFYGEGGTRIATGRYLFIERTELAKLITEVKKSWPDLTPAQITENLEEMFQKKFIPVGTTLEDNKFYVYHIDFFLNPVESADGGLTLFLGHPSKTEEILGEGSLTKMPSFNRTLWTEKTKQANLIEAELKAQGFTVQRTPIYFMSKNGSTRTLTWNNVIQSLNTAGQPSVFIPDYNLGDGPQPLLNLLKEKVTEAYAAQGLKVYYVEGGENFVDLNGQLRCSTGVLNYRTDK